MRRAVLLRKPRAFTLVELLLGTGLLLVFLAIVFGVYVNSRAWLQAGTSRLEAGHRLRLSGLRLDETLTDCRGVFHPAPDAASSPRLAFLDARNQLQVVFLDPSGNLTQVDVGMMKSGEAGFAKILGGPLAEFSVGRTSAGLLSYRLATVDENGRTDALQQILRLWGTE